MILENPVEINRPKLTLDQVHADAALAHCPGALSEISWRPEFLVLTFLLSHSSRHMFRTHIISCLCSKSLYIKKLYFMTPIVTIVTGVYDSTGSIFPKMRLVVEEYG